MQIKTFESVSIKQIGKEITEYCRENNLKLIEYHIVYNSNAIKYSAMCLFEPRD